MTYENPSPSVSEILEVTEPSPAQRARVPTPTPHVLPGILPRESRALIVASRPCDNVFRVFVSEESVEGVIVEVGPRRARPTLQVVGDRRHRPVLDAAEVASNAFVIVSSRRAVLRKRQC